MGAENNSGGRKDYTEDLGKALDGGDAIVTKNPLIHTHHEDRPRDPRLYNPKCALSGYCVPRNTPAMFPGVQTSEVERSHHRYRPQH
jgi:hypothetical protein